MENIKALEKSIATYKVAIKASKNDALKKKLREKIKVVEGKIADLKSKKGARTTSTKKKAGLSMTNAKRFAEAKKKRASQVLSTKRTDIEKDAKIPALKKGKRVAKESGATYYEYRENRIDRRPKRYARLEDGGMMEKKK